MASLDNPHRNNVYLFRDAYLLRDAYPYDHPDQNFLVY